MIDNVNLRTTDRLKKKKKGLTSAQKYDRRSKPLIFHQQNSPKFVEVKA